MSCPSAVSALDNVFPSPRLPTGSFYHPENSQCQLVCAVSVLSSRITISEPHSPEGQPCPVSQPERNAIGG